MRHPTRLGRDDDKRDVARLDEAMRVERQDQGAAWTKVLKRGLGKRFDIMKKPGRR